MMNASDSTPEQALFRAEEAVDRAKLAGINQIEIATIDLEKPHP